MKLPSLFNCILSLFAITSCSSLKKEEDQEKEDKENTIVVGRVYSIAKSEKIVLIEKYKPGSFSPNGIYHTLGSTNNTASVRPTGEKIRNLHAADLINGDPHIGDAVLMRILAEADETSEDEKAADEANSENTPNSDLKTAAETADSDQ